MATTQIAQAPGHVFYRRLNRLLSEAGFDAFVEELCEPYYAAAGRPGIPPGIYIRMLFVGYFEGIGSQRGIVWRCRDSLSLRDFLGIQLTDCVPDHSSLTRIRDRLPVGVVQQVFAFVLKMAAEKKLISGTQVGVDATLLEANAAMKSIVRRDTDEDWKQYVVRLMKEDGVIDDEDEPTDAEVRKYDRKRKGKKVSNQD
ncbi:MAG: transposase [Planctomycetaceae bacterium]